MPRHISVTALTIKSSGSTRAAQNSPRRCPSSTSASSWLIRRLRIGAAADAATTAAVAAAAAQLNGQNEQQAERDPQHIRDHVTSRGTAGQNGQACTLSPTSFAIPAMVPAAQPSAILVRRRPRSAFHSPTTQYVQLVIVAQARKWYLCSQAGKKSLYRMAAR